MRQRELAHFLFDINKQGKRNSKIFVGREKKGQTVFHRLFFCAATRVSGKTVKKRLPEQTSEACPLGEG